MANITINLSNDQFEVVKDILQEYAESLANDRLTRKVEREKSQLIKVLIAKTYKELAEAAAPIIAAEKIKAEAKEAEEAEEPEKVK